MIIRLLLLIVAIAVGGCTSFDSGTFASWVVNRGHVPGEIDFHGVPVSTGQIVMSEQGSPQSVFLGLMMERPQRFIHAGIIAVEDGQPMLYEAQGTIGIHFRGPPSDAVRGGIRKVPLAAFISRQRFVAIYDPPPEVDRGKVVEFARQAIATRTGFDSYFDLADSRKLYCTEFAARALEAGGAPPRRAIPRNANRSIRVVTDWLKVTAPEIIPAAAVAVDGQRVALLSRRHTPAQVEAYFAMNAELHRRFTGDQKLGNVFSFSRFTGLHFRPRVRAFMNLGNVEALTWSAHPPEEIDARVRKLANDMFGPYHRGDTRIASH